MATYRAIGATCEAIIRLLQQSWRPDLFDDPGLQFKVYHRTDFEMPMDTGVSLFLYRAIINNTQRTPPPKPHLNGHRRRSQLPLDLHFLLTPWAKEASLEHEILGWMMRAVEDISILSAGLLNSFMPDVFDEHETVEIIAGQLTNEDILRIWDTLPGDYQISIPYVARIVRIDSEFERSGGGPVLTRQLDFGVVKEP